MRILSCIILLVLFSCKQNQESVSTSKSVEDGGCFEIQTKLAVLKAQRDSMYQNNDVNPNDASGFALTQGTASQDARDSSAANPSSRPVKRVDDGGSDSADGTGTDSGNQVKKPAVIDPSSSSVASHTARLDQQIAQVAAELQKCEQQKLGMGKTVKPQGQGNAGHCDYNGQPYEILDYNCHSAANQSVKDDPINTGILSCGGDAPVNNSPAHHTFNYRKEGNMVVYYNWRETCKAPLKTLPPDINDFDHQPCVQKFCGKQYQDGVTKALDPGQLVEEPGPGFCALNSKDKTDCNSCCQFRGKYWDRITDDLRPTDRTFSQFMSQCYNTCSATFK